MGDISSSIVAAICGTNDGLPRPAVNLRMGASNGVACRSLMRETNNKHVDTVSEILCNVGAFKMFTLRQRRARVQCQLMHQIQNARVACAF